MKDIYFHIENKFYSVVEFLTKLSSGRLKFLVPPSQSIWECQNITSWVTCDQMEFGSYSSEGWEVPDQGVGAAVSAEGPVPGSQTDVCFLCPHIAEGMWGLCGISWATNSIPEGPSPLDLITSQRFHLLIPSLWVRLSIHEFGAGKYKYSVVSSHLQPTVHVI